MGSATRSRNSAEQPATSGVRARLCLPDGVNIEGPLGQLKGDNELLWVLYADGFALNITLKEPFSVDGTRSRLFQEHARIESIDPVWSEKSSESVSSFKEKIALQRFVSQGKEKVKAMQCYRWCDGDGPEETRGLYIIDLYSRGDGS